MIKRPRHSRVLAEPVSPTFLVDLRMSIDSAVARNRTVVAAAHSYEGWESGRETVNGWRTQIALVAEPERVIEVWYDNLDHDVCVSGDVEYQEWTWPPGDETAQRACLEEIDQLVESFARGRLPRRE
ncbi:hypothetical protein [Arthrobacter sp. B10-11]|uniref:hypothetical protein n=1 Tax=Arthrobacter sp. B10-11 TaxID=3081160 RepID=UPI0029535E7F|nr:hypothetical protein [Arthrobacter sp. B10-11]MDV8147437.1 hypothetical protein [Arthrobacter sp. B10-11]